MKTSICPPCGCSLVRLGIKKENPELFLDNAQQDSEQS